ncbi:hypothetical protein fh0823_08680 [Francisella halioticida]|uniref:Short-chain dehydrogenase n=1 Tax=Francisella halioticida TaxID=549298 RepID=A0ABM6LYR3_9GAMM|nr:hypothetical protein [Francisella halioticida]ASG67811.1 hypothetical protein CDV26_04880 [Francisella halioticida]BCD90729.1 hypothetical protein fh0823_08680 [Francisella halioticida]
MSEGGGIIITTSDTHDPEVIPMAKGPTSLSSTELNTLANGGPSENAMRVYATTKACNLLMARYLVKYDLCRSNHIQVIAYNPGATLGTQLGRNRPRFQRFLMEIFGFIILKSVGLFNPAFCPTHLRVAGRTLADLYWGVSLCQRVKYMLLWLKEY